jgi:hypothetical protein
MKIYLYEAGPLDHWENWSVLSTYPYRVYTDEMRFGSYFEMQHAHDKIQKMERLLIDGLIHFSKWFKNDIRGERLHYKQIILPDIPFGEENVFNVICVKCDNNGTCRCFAYSDKLAEYIPHDFEDIWELVEEISI